MKKKDIIKQINILLITINFLANKNQKLASVSFERHLLQNILFLYNKPTIYNSVAAPCVLPS